jgi:uncharacterized protein (TIGR02246 family)
MLEEQLAAVIAAADHAITDEDFDALMDFYADDAALVLKPGMTVRGKDAIRRAFLAVAEHFDHSLHVGQGPMQVIEGDGDIALVIMETVLTFNDAEGLRQTLTRRATYVFRRDAVGWRCVIDNSYGTDLLEHAA